MIGIILLIDSNRLLHNLPQSRQQLTTDKKVKSHRRVSSIAYYHKIAGSKPSCLRQAYLIGLKFKKLKCDNSVDNDSVIDSVVLPPCFRYRRFRQP